MPTTFKAFYYLFIFKLNSCRFLLIGFVLFGLVWVYGTATIVGYLMPNPFLYI